jgi:hypothetical protein
VNDLEITALIKRLSRPHPSGGVVIERAAIMATGSDSAQIIEWIRAHLGTSEAPPPARSLGLHGARGNSTHDGTDPRPTRFVLPAEALH